jgi:hypothetical protein
MLLEPDKNRVVRETAKLERFFDVKQQIWRLTLHKVFQYRIIRLFSGDSCKESLARLDPCTAGSVAVLFSQRVNCAEVAGRLLAGLDEDGGGVE